MPEILDNTPVSQTHKHLPLIVVVADDQGNFGVDPDRPLDWERVVRNRDGKDCTATIRASLDARDLVAGSRAPQRSTGTFGDLLSRDGVLDPNRLVRVMQDRGPDIEPVFLFEGYPMLSTAKWTGRQQAVSVSCLNRAQDWMRTSPQAQVIGRHFVTNPFADWNSSNYVDVTSWVTQKRCRFNAAGRPNRYADPAPYVVGEDTFKLFTFLEDNAGPINGRPAGYWSYVDALRYLAFWYIVHPLREDAWLSALEFLRSTEDLVGLPPIHGATAFENQITQRVEDEDVDAASVERAIGQLCNRAGLHFETWIRANDDDPQAEASPVHYLRVWADGDWANSSKPAWYLMEWPSGHEIPREAPFTPVDLNERDFHAAATANAAQQATLAIDHNLINNAWWLPGRPRHEVTLLLRPGWIPFDLLSYPTKYAGLENVPEINVLDNADYEDPDTLKEIAAYWKTELEGYPKEDDADNPVYSQFDPRHPRHDIVSEVGRKWIFPSDARYASVDGIPANSDFWRTGLPQHNEDGHAHYEPFFGINRVNVLRSPHIGGGIPMDPESPLIRNWAALGRPFGPCIYRYPGGDTLPPLIDYKIGGDPFDQDVGWNPIINTAARISATESAILFTINDIRELVTRPKTPGQTRPNWMEEIAKQRLYVRVTCTIEGDRRDVYFDAQHFGSAIDRRRTVFIDTGERFRVQDRGPDFTNSIFRNRPNDPEDEYNTVNERDAMAKIANELMFQFGKQVVSGDPEIPWIAHNIGAMPLHLGDVFTGARGVGLAFTGSPAVVSLHYLNAKGYRTKAMISDVRLDPSSAVIT